MNVKKTVDQMTVKQKCDLVTVLDSSIDIDLEEILFFFNDIFRTEMERNSVKHYLNSPNKSASRVLVDTFSHCRTEISRLYACFTENEMREAMSLIEQEFPDEVKNATTMSTRVALTNNLLDITNIHKTAPPSASSTTTTTAIDENLLVDMIQTGQGSSDATTTTTAVSPQSSSYQLYTSHHPIAVLELIGRYEEVFPVICEDWTTGGEFNNPIISYKRVGNASFDVIHVKERKLTFRRREFRDESEYVNELKMIKHKHLNLITAECIYKNLSNKAYFYLLYNYEANVQSIPLDEFAAETSDTRRPADFNSLHQLSILRDVSAALAYLYETNVFKKHLTIHGNLQPSNVMICFRDIKQPILSAKVFDFTKSTNITEPDNFATTFRDEFYRFGLIVYTALTFRHIERAQCENLHKRLAGGDEDSNLNTIRHELLINEQIADPTRNALFGAKTFMLTLFYKITRPRFEPKRDSMKNYQKYFTQLIDQYQNELKSRLSTTNNSSSAQQLTPKSNTNNANNK